MFRTIALTGFAALIAASTIAAAPEAQAQIGNIFSDPPPRPPGSVPRGQQPQQLPPDDEEQVPELPRGRLLPSRPQAPGQGVAPPGAVQSQPLAPPPGTTVIPQNTPPTVAVAPPEPSQAPAPGANAVLPGLPPGQRQPKGGPQSPATLQPGEEGGTEAPA